MKGTKTLIHTALEDYMVSCNITWSAFGMNTSKMCVTGVRVYFMRFYIDIRLLMDWIYIFVRIYLQMFIGVLTISLPAA